MTTRHQHDQTRQRQAINTAPTRIVPDCHGRATDLHGRDTNKHGSTRHKHGPSWTYTLTQRTTTALIRTKPDWRRTDNNFHNNVDFPKTYSKKTMKNSTNNEKQARVPDQDYHYFYKFINNNKHHPQKHTPKEKKRPSSFQ
ncbi:hypothetical protein DPMN_132342 [Dreissena polymorpha]|uniref:Uncharacterized protein n=1 Tax=Dreissena polymorpha TaxID=45954 RepID=A0A9D4JBZ6_DREPO|nr:hypothetical protein DPMN_132342 [Dreissena polymorpha]